MELAIRQNWAWTSFSSSFRLHLQHPPHYPDPSRRQPQTNPNQNQIWYTANNRKSIPTHFVYQHGISCRFAAVPRFSPVWIIRWGRQRGTGLIDGSDEVLSHQSCFIGNSGDCMRCLRR
ncbi:hypothetical protein ACHAXS_010219 [Conticribra weissflogii]